jgi:hypothetical protein
VDTALLDERYGRRPPRRGVFRAWRVVALAVFVVLAVAWLAWAGLRTTRTALTWQDLGTQVAGPDVARVSFQVSGAPGRTAVCAVQAVDAHGGVVGWRDVRVPVEPSGRATATAAVRTSRPAAGGGVSACR